MIYSGAYDPKALYIPTNVVYFQGSSYVALLSNSGVSPTGSPASSTDWGHLADQGATGAAGAKGDPGQGLQGPQGVPGTFNPVTASPWNTLSIGVFGDSYSQIFGNVWQLGVATRTGGKLGFQDARAGRTIGQMYECYGGTATGTNVGRNLQIQGWGTCGQANNGKAGNTLAQDIAGVDLMLIELGTNNSSEPFGTINDTVGAQTTYGETKAAIEGLQAANPEMKIIWIEPLSIGEAGRVPMLPGIVQAIDAVCAQYGVPVVKMYSESGVNKLNWSLYLLPDLLHPSPLGWQKVYIPMVTHRINQFSPMN